MFTYLEKRNPNRDVVTSSFDEMATSLPAISTSVKYLKSSNSN